MHGSVRKTISNCPPPPEAAGAVGAGVAAGAAFGCAPPGGAAPPPPPAKGARAVFATKPSLSARRQARSNSGVAVVFLEAPAAGAALEVEFEVEFDEVEFDEAPVPPPN